MSISLKEATETEYWLKLLYETDYISETEYDSMNKDVDELKRLLVATVKTTKNNLNK